MNIVKKDNGVLDFANSFMEFMGIPSSNYKISVGGESADIHIDGGVFVQVSNFCNTKATLYVKGYVNNTAYVTRDVTGSPAVCAEHVKDWWYKCQTETCD